MTKILTNTSGKVLLNSQGNAYILPEGSGISVPHPDPTISVNTSTGLITASHAQTGGQVTGGTTTATEQLTTQAAQTITPTTTDQTIAAGKFLTGAQTIKGDANLVASNIKDGVTIFGVEGTYEGSGGSVLTPTAGDYPVVLNDDVGYMNSSTNNLTSTGLSITIPVSGTYRLKWTVVRRSTSSYTYSSQLYRTRSGSTSAIGTANSTWTSTYYQTNTLDIACNANDVITVYVSGQSQRAYATGLAACVAQKLWTN